MLKELVPILGSQVLIVRIMGRRSQRHFKDLQGCPSHRRPRGLGRQHGTGQQAWGCCSQPLQLEQLWLGLLLWRAEACKPWQHPHPPATTLQACRIQEQWRHGSFHLDFGGCMESLGAQAETCHRAGGSTDILYQRNAKQKCGVSAFAESPHQSNA